MILLLKADAFLFSSIFILLIFTAHASFSCNNTCGSNHLPYPFGFSSGCQIQLNCSRNGEILVNNEFRVQYVTQDKIRINVQPQCNRSVQVFRNLFTTNFAPLSSNAILLHNCSSDAVRSCSIPAISVETHFESLSCSNSSGLSCLFDLTTDGFFYNSIQLRQCRSLLSSISSNYSSTSGVTSLDVQAMELGWWLPGKCHCSDHASCNELKSPAGPGYRCQCKDGFIGDGYPDPAAAGCRNG